MLCHSINVLINWQMEFRQANKLHKRCKEWEYGLKRNANSWENAVWHVRQMKKGQRCYLSVIESIHVRSFFGLLVELFFVFLGFTRILALRLRSAGLWRWLGVCGRGFFNHDLQFPRTPVSVPAHNHISLVGKGRREHKHGAFVQSAGRITKMQVFVFLHHDRLVGR